MAKDKDKNKKNQPFDPIDSNPDPITGQPGAHPVGTGLGAAGAGTIGAAVGGIAAGPVGAVVGSAIGAAVGGLMGKSAAEMINPTVENQYWQDNYKSRPYVKKGEPYEVYQPAYRAGYEGYGQYGGSGRTFEQAEPDLRRDYESKHGKAGLAWDKAKHAAQDAWDRVDNLVPGHDEDRSDVRTDATQRDAATVRLHDERLVADKHREKAGEVIVGKHVETETARVSVPIEREEVIIDRHPVAGQQAIPADQANFGDAEVAHVEVYEETPDIHKETFVREEVNVRKVVDRENATVEDQIRHEQLDLDEKGRTKRDSKKR